MSTSAEATVPTLTQQLQERVQQLEAHVQQLTAQAAAPVDSVPVAVTPKLKVKKPEPYDGTGSVQGFLTQARIYHQRNVPEPSGILDSNATTTRAAVEIDPRREQKTRRENSAIRKQPKKPKPPVIGLQAGRNKGGQ
ncbi:hypothetical protein DL768_006233 [Monosporascus sp. mg162]|nr:hypothetical protein DL768_006233 [Monosporascus sp. mg162]